MKKSSSGFYAHVFYCDGVGLSNPKLGTTVTQMKKIEILLEKITNSRFFKESGKNPIFLTLGDGAAVCYRHEFTSPLELALDLNKKLKKYNLNKKKKDRVEIRIGIYSDTILKSRKKPGGRTNYWGNGLIHAERVMNFGTSNHILLGGSISESLIGYSDRYRNLIHYLGIVPIKHGEKIPIYSAYGNDFGNKTKPNVFTGKTRPEIIEKTGRLILEQLSRQEMEPKKFLKILEQKEKFKLKLSLISAKKKKSLTKKVKGRLQ